MPWRPLSAALAGVLLAGCSSPKPATPVTGHGPTPALRFRIVEGQLANHFYRRGPVAAHLLARSGREPRLIVSFPAGDTGIGLWFQPQEEAVRLWLDGELSEIQRDDGLWGVSAVLRAGTRQLTLQRSLLGGNWSLRGYVPPGLKPTPLPSQVQADPPVIQRTTVDGKHRIRLELTPLGRTRVVLQQGRLSIQAPADCDCPLAVRLTALCNEQPLTPIPLEQLLLPPQPEHRRDLQALAFLSYQEKLLAGSWRFLDYFGRDTLLSVRLLMPAARPPLIEAGLGAVIARLSSSGQVAHYEEVGDFVALRNAQSRPRPADLRRPWLNYEMVDDDFLLAPVLARYLLDRPAGRKRAAAFLRRRTPAGSDFAAAVRRNLHLVLERARPFAQQPEPKRLISLLGDRPHGQWRDSAEGLGGGRYPFDVNVSLVPAALRAAGRLYRSGLLGRQPADAHRAEQAQRMARVWTRHARQLFRVELPVTAARQRIQDYARSLGLTPAPALAALTGDTPLVLHAIALDRAGKPIPVMHSDHGFALLFNCPPPAYLELAAQQISRPFPAGLLTPVGVVVANPALSDEAGLRGTFTTRHYHGTVVWSWQQALLAAGLRRQLERRDLPTSTRQALKRAEDTLWQVIEATKAQRVGELWSFSVQQGQFKLVPFGQGRGDVDESNAVQLWSTVYLAVRPPARLAGRQRPSAGR